MLRDVPVGGGRKNRRSGGGKGGAKAPSPVTTEVSTAATQGSGAGAPADAVDGFIPADFLSRCLLSRRRQDRLLLGRRRSRGLSRGGGGLGHGGSGGRYERRRGVQRNGEQQRVQTALTDDAITYMWARPVISVFKMNRCADLQTR